MYNYQPLRLAKSNIQKQNFSLGVNVIRDGSPSRIRIVLLISLGITTLPRSSILLTIPVAFIFASCIFRGHIMPRDLSVLVLFAEFGGLCREIDIDPDKLKIVSSNTNRKLLQISLTSLTETKEFYSRSSLLKGGHNFCTPRFYCSYIERLPFIQFSHFVLYSRTA